MYVHDIIEGLVVGAFAALNMIFAFQTKVAYPDVVLQALDHPWIVAIAYIVALVLFPWSRSASVLLILLLTAFVIETVVFARPLPNLTDQAPATMLSRQGVGNAKPYDEAMLHSTQVAGPPLSHVPLPQPVYPMYMYA